MPAYKDEKKGTWYVSFHYFDWTGKNVRKLKRGFATKRKAQEWEQSFLRTKAASMDMTFSEFFVLTFFGCMSLTYLWYKREKIYMHI